MPGGHLPAADGPHRLGGCSGAQRAYPGNRRGIQPANPQSCAAIPSCGRVCTRQAAAQHTVPGGELVAPATLSAAGTPMPCQGTEFWALLTIRKCSQRAQLCEFIIFKQFRFIYLQIHSAFSGNSKPTVLLELTRSQMHTNICCKEKLLCSSGSFLFQKEEREKKHHCNYVFTFKAFGERISMKILTVVCQSNVHWLTVSSCSTNG